jgi:hypothetical protein
VVALLPRLKVKNPVSWWTRLTGRTKRGKRRRNNRNVPIHLQDKVDNAKDFYKGFHWGNEPKKLVSASVSKLPKVATELGELVTVTYKTRKGSEPPTYYEHEFGEEGGKRPKLVADVDNKKLHVVGGDYTITDAGIEN